MVTGLAALLVMVTFLDLFAQLPTVAPYAKTGGATEVMIGLIVAAYSMSNLAGNLLAGQMLDKWGRKQALYIGLIGTGLALFAYTLGQSPGRLLIIRLFHGLTAGFLSPSVFTIIADLAPPQGRTRVMGIAGAFIGIAAIIGPAGAGILRARWGFNAVFLSVSVLMFLTMVITFFLMPRLLSRIRLPVSPRTPFPMRRLLPPCLAVFFLMSTLGILTAHLPLYLEAAGYERAVPGVMLSIFSLAAVVLMASPFGKLSDRWGRTRTLVVGLVGTGIALLILSMSPLIAVISFAMVLYGLSYGLIFPASSAAVADAAAAGQRGRAFAFFYATFSLGVVAGAITSGLVAGISWGHGVLPYYAGVAAGLGGAAALIKLRSCQ